MSGHHYKFNVSMSCGGCSGAVERVLKKLDGKFATTLTALHHISVLRSASTPCPSPSLCIDHSTNPSASYRR